MKIVPYTVVYNSKNHLIVIIEAEKMEAQKCTVFMGPYCKILNFGSP